MITTKKFVKTPAASKWAKKMAFEFFCKTGTMVEAYHCLEDGTAFKFYCDGLEVQTQLVRKWPKVPPESGVVPEKNLVIVFY